MVPKNWSSLCKRILNFLRSPIQFGDSHASHKKQLRDRVIADISHGNLRTAGDILAGQVSERLAVEVGRIEFWIGYVRISDYNCYNPNNRYLSIWKNFSFHKPSYGKHLATNPGKYTVFNAPCACDDKPNAQQYGTRSKTQESAGLLFHDQFFGFIGDGIGCDPHFGL